MTLDVDTLDVDKAWHDPQEVVSRALAQHRGKRSNREGAGQIGDNTRNLARAILRALKDNGYRIERFAADKT